ncbi:lipocalin family protein [Candidatus Neomarinimicrobiota bacterium]
MWIPRFFLLTILGATTILNYIKADMNTDDIKTVPQLDLERYAGTWYEIARFPHRFERGLVNVTATYTQLPNGKIEVVNRGRKGSTDGEESIASGKAWLPDPNEPGRLKVSFFWIFASDYKVFVLDEDYQYAMVTSSSKKYLWILARTPTLDETIYQQLLQTARDNGFDLSQLIKVPQDW